MNTFKGLRTVGYKVTDIAKAKAWYADALGVQPYFDEPFYVGFNVGGYELGLQPEGSETPETNHGVVAYWGVDDVKATYQHLLNKGATALEEPTDVGGDIMVAAVKDPWGNAFGIIYNPHFTTGN
jgi:predicted enzyme related to lactoylglutathione lyase